ncbi:hypothetical protein HG536_0B01200 [Torulaspora globosa]|uniref:Peptidyl-prolyl cis-trans isomerase n=1 Tax=Torulaspora globosa TaxID=48254 RepID=A0A7G3ZCM3_9SACH|nr:uncharacterized protein HG536_0B01200 [Torulaspora globosa]QLL31259.1 hypothetical protein HG536_0B01200 [Torulaspora globosa]
MSVLIETTVGEIVVDLDFEHFKIESYNFLKLCKCKLYEYQCLYNIRKNQTVEFGDPLIGFGDRKELRVHNTSIEGILRPNSDGEVKALLIKPSREDNLPIQAQKGSLGAVIKPGDPLNLIGSRMVITLNEEPRELENIVFFGNVVKESFPILDRINAAVADRSGRPLIDIRIRKMHLIHDPFPDPPNFRTLDVSQPFEDVRLPDDLQLAFCQDSLQQEIHIDIRRKELSLEIMGDLPGVGLKPSDKVLFVCKLNPLTRAKDIATIFQRFGYVKSVEIVRDKESGRSLGYGFIEFDSKKSCDSAYKSMDGVLIDDRRIHVDFSQSLKKSQVR